MSYKGLCVGGGRAGEWITKDKEAFSVRSYGGRGLGPDFFPIRISWSSESIVDNTAGIVTDYVHVRGDGGIDFWVPKGKDRNWAIRELARSYRHVGHRLPASVSDPELPGTDAPA